MQFTIDEKEYKKATYLYEFSVCVKKLNVSLELLILCGNRRKENSKTT